MQRRDHLIQDALELYAVAVMQQLAQNRGIAITPDADSKFQDFRAYCKKVGLTDADFKSGNGATYKSTVDKYVPCFFERLVATRPKVKVDFVSVEKVYRNANKKGDFVIRTSRGEETSVSLKNYRGAGLQSNSRTFNSFVCSLLFDGEGVGSFMDPVTGIKFRASSHSKRDVVLDANGYGEIKTLTQKLDALNSGIKARFVYGPDFAQMDPKRISEFDRARKECGNAGVAVTLQILALIPHDMIKSRLLKMAGLDGAEELLLLYQGRFTDSVTVPELRELRTLAQSPDTKVQFVRSGQTIRFELVSRGTVILVVNVPFTINANGAWAWMDEPFFKGSKMHPSEKVHLRWGERRPKKSKELATSTNTWVSLPRSIFIEACE